MELIKAKTENLTKKQILEIKKYAHFIDIGSEISCYNLSSKQVIKFFDINPINNENKLYIPNEIYGNNTYIFIDAIQKYYNHIISYTMKYIKGNRLGKEKTEEIFYNLPYQEILNYINNLINDSHSIANNGIQAFDCHENNIILTQSGFTHIDPIDFLSLDKNPSIIAEESIKLMCTTIWDSLINPYLSPFISHNNLSKEDFLKTPYEFIQKLQEISQRYSDNEIITLDDTKKLQRKKK